MGLATVLGLPARGFFIPYRYAAQISPADRRNYAQISACFAAATPLFGEILDLVDGFRLDLLAIAGNGAPPAPRWHQDWFPALDAAVLYALIRERQPSRIIEIGSGHSTRFAARALADGGIDAALTAIDPAPRADIARLPVTLICEPLQRVELSIFDSLASGDFLVVDSSHILMPGSDVDIIINDILPRLPSGVLVHFHDMFLPDPYPANWAWRAYNEQVAVAALIGNSGLYALMFASNYVRTSFAERLAGSVISDLQSLPGAIESSLWLSKR